MMPVMWPKYGRIRQNPKSIPVLPLAHELLVPLIALARRQPLPHRQFLELDVLLFVEQREERLAERLGRQHLFKGEQQRRQQQQVREHGHAEGDRDEQAERAGAVEAAHGKHEEAEEQHDGRVHHAHTRFLQGEDDRLPYVPGFEVELLPVFGQKVDRIIHRDAEGHAEDQNRRRLDRNARPPRSLRQIYPDQCQNVSQ